MSIVSIQSQPAANSIAAAYRPVVIRVRAKRTDDDPIPPVVYCDIYFNDVFYKTLSKSQYSILNDDDSDWDFDIQDAAQEYLQKYLGEHSETLIVEATPIITKAVCKFRSSGYDGDGFITPEGTAPIQGTGGTDPVAGDGTASNTFYIVNATLQHEDNQDLATHLFYHKKRTWTSDAHPLSHRPDHYKLAPTDSDIFPIIYTGAGTFKKLRLNYRLCGQAEFSVLELSVAPPPTCPAIISQPIATQNGTGWLVSWNLLSGAPGKYFVSTPAVSGGAPHETFVTNYQYLFAELAVGEHVITVRPLCFIDGNWYLGASKTVTITVEACVPVGIVGAPDLPDATVGIVYDYSFELSGSQPFALANIVKPAWMTVTIVGSTVQFGGTPDVGDVGDDTEVSFDVTNCGGGNSVAFDDEVDVVESDPVEGTPVNLRFSNDDDTICAQGAELVYIPPPDVDISSGVFIFTDINMTMPKIGSDFVSSEGGQIYNMNSGTGEVTTFTGNSC